MKSSIKIQISLSETRQRVNELLGKGDAATEDEKRELAAAKAKMTELEAELREALSAEAEEIERRAESDPGGTPEQRELDRLAADASVAEIFGAALEHRATSGQTAELQAHIGLQPNQVPLALLREPVEQRAVTPAPANVGQNQAAVIPGVFPASVSAFLGVDMPSVGVGEAVYPVLETNATVHTPAENGEATETTGSFTADVLSPSRLQASFFYSREDRARFAGMDDALRQNLREALSDALDKQVISGTNGLLTGTNLANHNVNAATDFAGYLSAFGYGRVDGTYATMTGDVRIVAGSATYAHMGAAYRSNNADYNAVDALSRITGGVRVSAHVPAAANSKQNAAIRLGMRRDMVAPVWEGVTLIPDEITKAGNGQIVVTAVMLHAVKVLRSAGFHKQQTQHK